MKNQISLKVRIIKYFLLDIVPFHVAICIMPNHVLQSLCKNISLESCNKYVFNTLHVLAYQKVNQLISCCENRLLFYFNVVKQENEVK